MDETDISISTKLLVTMHNTCAVRPEIARTSEDLSNIIQVALDDVTASLTESERNGYVNSYIDQQGVKRFYLTGKGILKVCSSFT